MNSAIDATSPGRSGAERRSRAVGPRVGSRVGRSSASARWGRRWARVRSLVDKRATMAEVSARPSRSAPQARARARPGPERPGPDGGARSHRAPAGAAGRGRLRGAPHFQPLEHPLSHRLHRFRRPPLVRADDAVIVTDGRYGEQAPAELALSGAPARTEALGGAEQVELLGELVKGIGRLGLEGEHISWGALAEVVRGLGQGCRAGAYERPRRGPP